MICWPITVVLSVCEQRNERSTWETHQFRLLSLSRELFDESLALSGLSGPIHALQQNERSSFHLNRNREATPEFGAISAAHSKRKASGVSMAFKFIRGVETTAAVIRAPTARYAAPKLASVVLGKNPVGIAEASKRFQIWSG